MMMDIRLHDPKCITFQSLCESIHLSAMRTKACSKRAP